MLCEEQLIYIGINMYESSCLNFEWTDAIYDNKRRNRFPERACRREYNIAAPAGCCLPAPFVAQPFLRYTEPYSYDEFRAREAAQAAAGVAKAAELVKSNGTTTSTAPSNVSASANTVQNNVTSQLAGDTRPSSFLPPPPLPAPAPAPAYCCTKPGATPRCYPPYAQACAPCAITLSCGTGTLGEVCAPGPWFQRREVYQGATYMPASSMPSQPFWDYFDPASLYVYDTPSEFQRSYDGIVNGHLPAFAKFAFQTENERNRLQYGIYPPIPTAPPCCGIDAVKPTCQLDRPLECAGCGAPPITYNQKYLDGIGDCGCATPNCNQWVRGSTNRCNTCLGRLASAPCPCDSPAVRDFYGRLGNVPGVWNVAPDLSL